MISKQIDLQLRSPLCIARRPTAPGQPIETLSFISGTVLRGGLASAWLRGRRYEELSQEEQARFRLLFLSSGVAFGNCLPMHDIWVESPIDVVPSTAWHQKYDTGWFADGGRGVYDQWVPLMCGCPNDDLERLNDEYIAWNQEKRGYQKIVPRTRLIARTAIDPHRGTARERMLSTLEVLDTGQLFRGIIRGSEELVQELCETVCQPGTLLTMGQGRSRGLGEVMMKDVVDVQPEHQRREVLQRVLAKGHGSLPDDEQGLLKDALIYLNQRIGSQDDTLFMPVTLESDVLLRDNYLLPSSDPQPSVTLGRYVSLPPSLATTLRLEPRGVIQQTAWIGGWDDLRRLPRSPTLAIVAGSVWTFRVPHVHLDMAVEWWCQAQRHGLGERCTEGFGRVRLCHPVHMQEGAL